MSDDLDRPIHLETFPVKSRLSFSELIDLRVWAELTADHEGQGTITIDYTDTTPEHRLQALISLLAALVERLAFAIGNESVVGALRGVADNYERREEL